MLFAFGVEPKNVRFVATSATIGKQGDPETKTGLLKFLTQVAGVHKSQVVVIEGERKFRSCRPRGLAQGSPEAEELASLKPEALFDRLGSTPSYANRFRKISHQALTFKAWCDAIGANGPEVGKAVPSRYPRREERRATSSVARPCISQVARRRLGVPKSGLSRTPRHVSR